MSIDDLVEPSIWNTGILASHLVSNRMRCELPPLLNEQRQIAQFAVFHNEVDVGRRFDAVMEGNDMGVTELLEDLDLAIQIVLELLV